ncbi:MAG: DUF3426 domain-containing protein [Alcanivorax sp.]|nr:DUF3426 domain-containing protein [Alcanivorax sp.]
MTAQYKTRCPHCGAQFKVTDEHLKQARGAVRCGSCLQIFQATDFLVNGQEDKAPANSDNRWENALDDQPELPGEAAEGREQHASSDEDSDDGLSMEGMELSDSFLNLDNDSDDQGLGEDFSDMQGAGRETLSSNADESWAEALLKELEDDNDGAPPAPAKKTSTAPAAPASRPSRGKTGTAAAPARPAPAPKREKDIYLEQHAEDDSGDGLFGGLDLFGDDFGHDQVEAVRRPRPQPNQFQPRRDWASQLKWIGLALVAVVLLAGQYAFFNFDRLARTPQWRPLYAQACNLLGCRLPNRSDISQLRGANLVVRSNPNYQNSLIVDAILFNEADYPQPFPVLELSFTSLNGKPVASRRFMPSDYLHGDLRNMATMPQGTPLHISLQIVDPGKQAVNYNLKLLPAPQSNKAAGQS